MKNKKGQISNAKAFKQQKKFKSLFNETDPDKIAKMALIQGIKVYLEDIEMNKNHHITDPVCSLDDIMNDMRNVTQGKIKPTMATSLKHTDFYSTKTVEELEDLMLKLREDIDEE